MPQLQVRQPKNNPLIGDMTQKIWMGTGAPGVTMEDGSVPSVGDVYFRRDTPGVANQFIYVVTSVGPVVWTGKV